MAYFCGYVVNLLEDGEDVEVGYYTS